MWRYRLVLTAAALLLVAGPAARGASAGEPGFRIVERSDRPLLEADRPWESSFLAWVRVIRTTAAWRLWYLSRSLEYTEETDGFLCYAESADGVRWVKPNLRLVEFDGSRDNNILLDSRAVGGVQGHDIVLDPAAPPAERYKLVVIKPSPDRQQYWIHAMTSPDGLRFTPLPQPIFRHNSDTQNTLVRENGRWRMYVRMWHPRLWIGERVVGLTESSGWTSFPAPRIVFRRDTDQPEELQFYNPALSKLCDRLYVMMPSAFMTRRNIVVPHLAWSRDGERFTPVGPGPFVGLREGMFDSKSIYVAPGAVPGPRPGTWWFFYLGMRHGHDNPLKEKRTYMGAVGRILLEVRDSGCR